jgi:shikimate dehydrogenase
MRLYGLIGFPLAHSFSASYFNDKFRREDIAAIYKNFEVKDLMEVKTIIERETNLCGLNVTLPYKQQILSLTDWTDERVARLGAANCLRIVRGEGGAILKAYNTDMEAFLSTLKPLIKPHYRHVLILGTGGSAKAIYHALNLYGGFDRILFVSRTPVPGKSIGYDALKDRAFFERFDIIINCTPVGMYPAINDCPDLRYDWLRPDMLLYDLIYNPADTQFLQQGKKAGCLIKNGMEMLIKQAELSWKIWNE